MALKKRDGEALDFDTDYSGFAKDAVKLAEDLLSRLALNAKEKEALKLIAEGIDNNDEQAQVFLYKVLDWSRASKTRRTL